MIRLTKEEALAKILELERARLETLTRESLVEICMAQDRARYGVYSEWALSNALSALSNGEFGCERPDLETVVCPCCEGLGRITRSKNRECERCYGTGRLFKRGGSPAPREE